MGDFRGLKSLASTIRDPCVYYPGACVYYPGRLRLLSGRLRLLSGTLSGTLASSTRDPCVYFTGACLYYPRPLRLLSGRLLLLSGAFAPAIPEPLHLQSRSLRLPSGTMRTSSQSSSVSFACTIREPLCITCGTSHILLDKVCVPTASCFAKQHRKDSTSICLPRLSWQTR